MKTLNLSINLELVESFDNNPDTIARVYYPDEGNLIQIKKGLNTVDLHESIYHEVGHIIDWYISEGIQSSQSIKFPLYTLCLDIKLIKYLTDN